MKTLFKFLGLFTLTTFLFVSCSEDDPAPPQLTASDLTTTIAENPQEGDALGIVAASQSEGVSFSILTSDPSGAFGVNPITGEVTVADASAFDFENRTSATASIRISSGDQETFSSVFVTITDADDLLTLLTTSRAEYEATSIGWVQITEAEYNLLAERMADIFQVGASNFNYGAPDGNFIDDITVSNNTFATIPFDSYLFAFRYTAMSDAPEAQVRPKVSEQGPITGFIGRGPLPPHDEGDVFFVYKGAQVRTSSSTSYLGLYSPYSMGYKNNSGTTLYWRNGNGSDLPMTASTFETLIQGLTTTVKQWD